MTFFRHKNNLIDAASHLCDFIILASLSDHRTELVKTEDIPAQIDEAAEILLYIQDELDKTR